jgi:hypothetical protein
MKKTLILGAFAGLMMVSCAKDYNCQCVESESISQTSNTINMTINGKKKDAKAQCEANSSSAGTYKKVCTLK